MRIRHNEVMIVNGRLKQVGFSFKTRANPSSGYSAVFLCECGRRKVIGVTSVRTGNASSCGCRRTESNTTHGHAKAGKNSSEYRIWAAMIRRCKTQKDPGWENYGGRGITVCEEWKDFSVFLADMGPRPAGFSIDRENNDGNYEPGNCRWVSRKEQNRNTRSNVLMEFNGKIQCLSAWAEELKINILALRTRIRLGWSVERALTTPVRKIRKVVN